MTGEFKVDVPRSAARLYMECGGGFRKANVVTPVAMVFTVYANDSAILKQDIQPNGRSYFYIADLPLDIRAGGNFFRFEIDTASGAPGMDDDPWGVWTVARLWGTLPSSPVSPSTGSNSMAQATFIQQANCRSGPSTGYDIVTSFEQGQTVDIYGRNPNHSNTWWYVRIPNSND